ncbi:RidA family protein [Leptospira gomenensis]|uniref:RidA family protein n=1 Tax=Leptospira gomenensis TaxID=2484974 RepID=A0A5F1YCC4_9LEPT|nr:RidA family protein [Leptospira gomenensis]TGK34577.1 RidA family protein [Leptospira gomenensis]TGK40113.1 RidA family protein [Leptospira gomenensis]TGK40477.1 RidA family protein [Leptospira gomenensis]TGK55622.1 RidA family protein [Leptospira gomenensis]
MSIQTKIESLGYKLPPAPQAIAAYIPANRSGNLVFTSGQLPLQDGKLMLVGKLGEEFSVEDVRDAMIQASLNAIAAAAAVCGGPDHLERIVKIGVFVACVPGFTDHHLVANHGSNFLLSVFGEAGRHARFAVGTPSLPLGSPVEVEVTFQVADVS